MGREGGREGGKRKREKGEKEKSDIHRYAEGNEVGSTKMVSIL